MSRRSSDLKFHCTASSCGRAIKCTFDAFPHPLLNCLVCRKCHGEYKTGDFSLFEEGVDDLGDDNYCRWCVDGGNLFTCSNTTGDDPATKCHYSFCVDCIKSNFPDDEVLRAEELGDDYKWICYACDPSRMEKLKLAANEAIILLSQRDLKRSKENATSDRNASNKVASNKVTQDAEVSSTKTVNLVENEVSGSATKKRKIDSTLAQSSKTNPAAQSILENARNKDRDRNKDKVLEKGREKTNEKDKDTVREKDRDMAKEKERVKEKDREEQREKQKIKEKEKEKEKAKEKEKEKEKAKEKEKEEEEREKQRIKEKEKDKEKDTLREPETVNRPPLEPVRPLTSILRNLKSPNSSIPKPPVSNQISPKDFITVDKNLTKSTTSSTLRNRQSPSSVTPKASGTDLGPNASGTPVITSLVDGTKTKPVATAVNLQQRTGPSKQLKSTNEAITPTTRVRLNDRDLKERLEFYSKTKQCCVKEIDAKFSNISEMFFLPANHLLLKTEVDELTKALEDFKKMINDLKSLYSSQRQ